MKELNRIEFDVLDIEEHDDGSATVKFGFDPETLRFILSVGINKILKDGLEAGEDYD